MHVVPTPEADLSTMAAPPPRGHDALWSPSLSIHIHALLLRLDHSRALVLARSRRDLDLFTDDQAPHILLGPRRRAPSELVVARLDASLVLQLASCPKTQPGAVQADRARWFGNARTGIS